MSSTLILFDPTIPDAEMLAEAIAEGVRSVASATADVRPLAEGDATVSVDGYDALMVGALRLPESLATVAGGGLVASPFGTAGSGWGLLEPLARLGCLIVPPANAPNEPDAERDAARRQGERVARVAGAVAVG